MCMFSLWCFSAGLHSSSHLNASILLCWTLIPMFFTHGLPLEGFPGPLNMVCRQQSLLLWALAYKSS